MRIGEVCENFRWIFEKFERALRTFWKILKKMSSNSVEILVKFSKNWKMLCNFKKNHWSLKDTNKYLIFEEMF